MPQPSKSGRGGARPGAGRKPCAVKAARERILDETLPEAALRRIIQALVDAAVAGDVKAAALLLAYRWGKPTEKVEVAGSGGGPLSVFVDL
jgi:hypothetical protein